MDNGHTASKAVAMFFRAPRSSFSGVFDKTNATERFDDEATGMTVSFTLRRSSHICSTQIAPNYEVL
jgi:hypothetical protein